MAVAVALDGAAPVAPVPGDVDALIDLPRVTALQVRIFVACALVLFCDGYDMQSLALAVPIVHVVASGLLFERGIMLKDGAALERAAQVDAVIACLSG